jgi:hypothetical protein
VLGVFLAACGASEPASDRTYTEAETLAAMEKGACGSCHAIPGVPNAMGVIAPDLSNARMLAEEHLNSSAYTGSAKDAEAYIREAILDPNVFIAPKCPNGACTPNVMPATLKDILTSDEVNAIVSYLHSLPEGEFGGTGIVAAPQEPTFGTDIVLDPADLADGTTFKYWTFNGTVPGPFLRVRVGDTMEVHLKNSGPDSMMAHSVDFHATTGPGGGAVATQTMPGGETMFTFKALNPGLYVYHCATPMVAHHIANGMYGLILVEPEGGLPPVDREFYIMQGELYTAQPFGTKAR